MIDFDGDCLSDLFLTVVDQSTGKSYYEIYLRRERESAGDDSEDTPSLSVNETENTLRGLNTFCLVAREEIPASSNNLFHFADIDRDAMIDMLFVTKNDLNLNIYYNKLLNQ